MCRLAFFSLSNNTSNILKAQFNTSGLGCDKEIKKNPFTKFFLRVLFSPKLSPIKKRLFSLCTTNFTTPNWNYLMLCNFMDNENVFYGNIITSIGKYLMSIMLRHFDFPSFILLIVSQLLSAVDWPWCWFVTRKSCLVECQKCKSFMKEYQFYFLDVSTNIIWKTQISQYQWQMW